MKKRLLASCILLALTSPPNLYAQETDPLLQEDDSFDDEFGDDFDDEFGDFYGSDEFISIATGTKKTIDKAPAIASVITAEQIRLSGARNLIDALKSVPGLNISRSSQSMGPKFNFRGVTSAFGPQTLLMVNGVPTKSAVRGDNHIVWGEYPINSVSRIEIIRGPGSALYGADAFAGVINIIMKDADELSTGIVGGGVGSHDTVNAWLNTGMSSGDLKIGLSAEYLASDGHNEIIQQDAQFGLDALANNLFGLPPVTLAPGPVNTSFKSLDAYLNVKYQDFDFGFSYQDRSDVGTGQGIAEALDPSGRFAGKKVLIDAIYETDEIAENWKFKAHINYYRSTQEVEENLFIFPAGTFFGAFPEGMIGNPGWKEDRTTFEFRADYSGADNHLITFGGGHINQDLYEVTETKNFFADFTLRPNGIEDVSDTDEVFSPEADRNDNFFFIQDIWQIAPDWELTTGVRYDNFSDFGSTVNPRIALVWSSSLKSTTKFLYGRAFRAPNFAELLVVNNPVALGNPDVSPETIDSIEAAYIFKHNDKHSSSINVFYYQIDDFINFEPDVDAPTSTAQNVGERTGYGVELETGFSLTENFSVKANYSYVKAEDDLVNDDVGDYPNHQVKFELLWQIAEFVNLHSTFNHIGDRKRPQIDPRDDLQGYNDVGFNLEYHNSSGWNISLSARNLLDDDIFEPSASPTTVGGLPNIPFDLPMAGTTFNFKVSKEF